MVPERVRFVQLVMATGPDPDIMSMISMACEFKKVVNMSEVLITVIYVCLTLPHLKLD